MGDRWNAVAALVDRSRRAIYDYVRRQDHPVSREEAAGATRISRNLAAFHLDKLVDAGLLAARYQPPPGRPRGRGRTPKVYEPAGDGLTVTIPERRYELIAHILADAVAEDPAHAAEAAHRHARQRGHALGQQLRQTRDGHLLAALREFGFEPEGQAAHIQLRNCPFQALAAQHTALVCDLNHAFLTGLLDGLATTGMRAELRPRPPACCVTLTRAPQARLATDDPAPPW